MAEAVEQDGPVDAVIGIVPPAHDGQAAGRTIARIAESAPPLKIAVVHPPFSANGTDPLPDMPRWRLIANPQLGMDPSAMADSLAASCSAVFGVARELGAPACAVVVSDLSSAPAGWISLLLRPVLDEHFDLVTPCYARRLFEGMINRSIAYPLIRALYGKQIRNPLGPDFGISRGLVERVAGGSRPRLYTLPTLAAEAISDGMTVCQAHLGPRSYPGTDWTNVSSLLAQILGPLFLDVERYAAHWQRARGSQPIREFGQPATAAPPGSGVDIARLMESFQLGTRNLLEVWGLILPPSTLVELRRMPAGGDFRMRDVTWARVVYDFALAHRLRTIGRDQVLRALTPIYLGWVASYARELENASPEAVEERLERLCRVFEETKSYFVSRWRWPDRFNP